MADLTVGASSASTESTAETTETSESTIAGSEETTSSTRPQDSAETASDENDVPTRDLGSFVGSLADKAKKATTTAWELTARARKRANEEAAKPRDFFERAGEKGRIDVREMREARANADGDEFWENAAETAGGSRHAMKAQRDLYEATGWGSPLPPPKMREAETDLADVAHGVEHAYHVAHEVESAAHKLDVVQSTVRNAAKLWNTGGSNWYSAGKGIIEHGELTHGSKLGKGMKAFGGVAFGYEVLTKAPEILKHGWSVNSVEPAADLAASAIGTFGGPVGTAFSLGYSAGGWIDSKLDVSGKFADAMLEDDIQRTTQIGFLAERAKEMNLAAGYRTRSGSWTDRDEYRMRSIVREAREHGLVNSDGSVSRERVYACMPKGAGPNEVDRVVGGIERALELEQAVANR